MNNLLDLVKAYEASDAAVSAAEAEVERLIRARSAACEALAKAMAPRKVITIPGRGTYTVVSRFNKSMGYHTWFLKRTEEAVVIGAPIQAPEVRAPASVDAAAE